MKRDRILLTMVLVLPACGKGSNSTPMPLSVSDSASPSSGEDASSASLPARLEGIFKTDRAELYIPENKDWASAKWRGDNESAGIGEEKVTLTIARTGEITGEGTGAVGDIMISGLLRDGAISGTIRRKNATEAGFVGSFLGSASGEKAVGTVSLSLLPDARVLRKGVFELAAKH